MDNMVESDYGGMNELFKLSACMKNATNLEKCAINEDCDDYIYPGMHQPLVSQLTECLTEQKHSNHSDKCSYSIILLHSTLIHDVVVNLRKMVLFSRAVLEP